MRPAHAYDVQYPKKASLLSKWYPAASSLRMARSDLQHQLNTTLQCEHGSVLQALTKNRDSFVKLDRYFIRRSIADVSRGRQSFFPV